MIVTLDAPTVVVAEIAVVFALAVVEIVAAVMDRRSHREWMTALI